MEKAGRLPLEHGDKVMITSKEKGQTVLEVIVAMAILSITLSGIITLLTTVANSGASSEARALAVNYAQEAIDAVKTIRDNEYCSFFSLDNTRVAPPMNYYKVEKIAANNNWRIVTLPGGQTEVDIFPTGSNEALATDMKRSITLSRAPDPEYAASYISDDEGRRVTVTISWVTKGSSTRQEYKTTTDIYKWKY